MRKQRRQFSVKFNLFAAKRRQRLRYVLVVMPMVISWNSNVVRTNSAYWQIYVRNDDS